MVHSGLSVTVAGYCLWVERDEAARIAHVRACRVAGGKGDGRREAGANAVLRGAAARLAARARRFIGPDWTVAEWSGMVGAW